MEKSTQNLWANFGFRDNPFDINALPINPEYTLSIKSAYISREVPDDTVDRLTNFLRNPGGGRIMIEGVSGIGKTTYVNSYRYHWCFEAKDKLFTSYTAIQIQSSWTAKEFLISSLFSLVNRLRLEWSQKKFQRNKQLVEIASAVGVYFNRDVGFGIGAQVPLVGGGSAQRQQSTTITIGNITVELLFSYLQQLVSIVKEEGYHGLVLHYDNLETVDQENLQQLFEEIRDYIQTSGIYFIFVGNPGTFQDVIVPSDRVRSIFNSNPIVISPLSLDKVYEIIFKRCQVCAIGESWITPVDHEMIEILYKAFDGKLRPIMNEIVSLVTEANGNVSFSNPESLLLLQNLKEEKLNFFPIKESVMNVFRTAISLRKFTASELAKAADVSRQFISKDCIEPLEKYDLIFLTEKRGTRKFYEVHSDYLILGVSIE